MQEKVFHVVEINVQNFWDNWRAWNNVWWFSPFSKQVNDGKMFSKYWLASKVLESENRPVKEINTDHGKVSSVQALKEDLAHISSASCLCFQFLMPSRNMWILNYVGTLCKLIVFKESADFFSHLGLLLIVTRRFYTVISFLKISYYFLGLANDFSTNSTKSVLYSTPKIKDTCLQSPSREVRLKGKLVKV